MTDLRPPKGPTLLLVEDDLAYAELIADGLADPRDRYGVLSAHSLDEARRHVARADLVLLDLNLPDSSGLGTLDAMREACADSVPVVVLTGHDDEELGLEAVRRGAADYLSKRDLPVDLLRRSVRYALERAHLRQQVLAAQRMEAIGRLAGGIAHDFNNVLAIIQSHAWLLADETLTGEAREDAMTIVSATERGAELTEQLLAVARRQHQVPRVLDLAPVLQELERMLRRAIPRRLTLRWSIASEGLWVCADRAQLEQVVMNLVVNAADATDDTGAIDVGLDRVELAGSERKLPAGSYARLTVSDSGVGMDQATLDRIFEPFFTTKGDAGTGLGLATVYGIIKQSGGHIDVSSVPGAGTRFVVHLPLETHATRVDETGPVGHGPESGTILLVDADPLVRASASRILERLGYDVVEAQGATEAVQLVASGLRADGLLTAIALGQDSGPRLAERLRATLPHLGVVLMGSTLGKSALEVAASRDAAPIAHARVAKPLTTDALGAAIRHALGPQRAAG